MKTIRVDIPCKSYDIMFNNLDILGECMSNLNLGNKALVVTNPIIEHNYGKQVVDSLLASGFEVDLLNLPPGEENKTLAKVERIYNKAQEMHLERSSTLVALGGGIIGDMTGFAAATWLRGINFVQVPTTLLSMVDASIGGKTAVNHQMGKNLVGAFHQPKLVLIDRETLDTLPLRELKSGLAEVIKYAVIWDAGLFTMLEKSKDLEQFYKLDSALINHILYHSCRAKADIVSKDELELDLRVILNYGHTIGHVIETLSEYQVNHGQAVAIGMVVAGRLAVELNLWPQELQDRQVALIERVGLPIHVPDYLAVEDIIKALKTDKKVNNQVVHFILPTAIGSALMSDQVGNDLIRHVLG